MRLDQILSILLGSAPDEWHYLSSDGAWDSFLWTLNISTIYELGEKRQEIELTGHHSRAVYRPDVSLGLAWGMTFQEDFTEGFTEIFPDSRASPQYCDILWNGVPVDRYTHVIVDGGRVRIPLPDRPLLGGQPVGYSLRTTPRLIGRLVSGIIGGDQAVRTYEQYIEQAGIVLLEDE